jgi:predicted kinase
MGNKLAIFVCGSGGSGKTTFVNQHFGLFKQVNVDIPYEELLNNSGIGLKINEFNPTDLSKSAEFFERAKDISYATLMESIEMGENIVIDSIGRNSDYVLQQRKQLKLNGYDTVMFMLYAPLELCIERVKSRNRVYDESITIDSWYLSYNNIVNFKKEFSNDFYLVFSEENVDWDQKISNIIQKKKLNTNINQKDKYL